MRSTTIQSLLALSCLRTVVAQYAFSIPEPGVANFDPVNDITQYTVVNFIWVANSTYQPTLTGQKLLDDDGNISVWITSFDDNSYTHCLTPSANSETGGSWSWNVTLSADEIDANGGKFVYRLKPTVSSANAPFDTTEDECPSRGFTIKKAMDAAQSASVAAASSASVASAASASRAAASQSAQTTQTGQSTATTTGQTNTRTGAAKTPTTTTTGSPTPNPSSGGLSGGAKAGIAIGVVAIAGIVAAAIFYLFRRRHATNSQQAAELSGTAQYAAAPMMQDPKHVYGYTDNPHNVAPAELPDSYRPPVELPGSQK